MRFAAAVLALASSGCSLVLVKGPTQEPIGTIDEDCTTSRAWPIVDLVWAGLLLAGGIGAIAEASSTKNRHSAEAAVTMLPTGVTFAIVALLGFQRVGKCRDQRAPTMPQR